MATDTFSGNSSYQLEANAGRSGKDIYVDVYVNRVGSYQAWSTASQAWSVTIDGQKQDFTWTYDFRSSTRKYLGRVWRRGLAIGNRAWSVGVNMASGIGSASVSGTVNIPPDAPSAPTLNSTVRNSDSSITVNWTRAASSSAPYTSQQVQRRELGADWSSWVTVANLAGSTTSGSQSYADTAVISNRLYQYRVVGYNSSGNAISNTSPYTMTTPGAPEVSLAATSATQVTATITPKTPHSQYQIELQYSSGGGAWTTLTTLAAGTNTYTWTPPAAATIQVRARSVNKSPTTSDPGYGLASAYANSNIVPLQQPPLAPTNLKPNGITLDAAQSVKLEWTYTSADTSDQTAFEVERSTNGGSTWSSLGKVTSSAKEYTTSSFVKNTDYLWRVRTWGVHANPSPYSAPASLRTEDAPSTAITSPLGVAETATVTAVWQAITGTQTSWKAELLKESEVIQSKSGNGTATSTTFTPKLENGSTYTVRVQVRNSSGLWSPWAESTFLADFPTPAPADVALGWDDDRGSVLVTVDNPNVAPKNLATRPSMELGSGQVVLRTNEHTNPVPASASGYSLANGATIAYETSSPQGPCILVTTGTGTSSGLTIRSWTPPAIGAALTVSCDVTAAAAMSLRFTSTGGIGANGTDIAFAAGETKRISITFIATSTTAGSIYLIRAASGAAQQFRVQNVLVEQTDEVRPYFDGAMATAEVNLAPNPLGPNGSNGSSGWRGSSDTIEYLLDDGQYVVQMTETGAAGGYYLDPNSNFGYDGTVAKVGDKIRFSVDVWTDDQQSADRMRLRVSGYNGATIIEAGLIETAIPTETWVRLTLEVTVSANPATGYFRPLVWPATNGGVGARLRVRRAVVQIGKYLGGNWFFEGTRPSAVTTNWTGTANASTSDFKSLRTTGLAWNANEASYQTTEGATSGNYAAMHRAVTGAANGQRHPVPGAVSGTPYHIAMDIFPVWSGQVRIYFRNNVDSSAAGQVEIGNLNVVAGQPIHFDTVATLPAGSTSTSGIILIPTTSTAGDKFAVDSLIVTEGEQPIPYFDGDSDGAAWDGVANGSASSRAATASNTVYRSYDGETWELVEEGVPLDGTISDGEVRLNTEVFYMVEAVSPLGTVTRSISQGIITETMRGYWSVGPNFNTVLNMRMGLGDPPMIDLETGLAYKERHYFAGRLHPVEYSGAARMREGQASFLVGTLDERNQAIEMSYQPAPHLFRLPDGTTIYASIDPVETHRVDEGFYTVETSLVEVER